MASPVEDKVKRYKKIGLLGEGQFAKVYKAKDTKTGLIVAVKKIKMESKVETKDGADAGAMREITFLREMKHPNVIGLLDVFIGPTSKTSLVLEFMDTDLEVIIKDKNIVLSQSHIKSYMIMTLRGLEFLHKNFILHRDLKPNNLLINDEGVLKIADLGHARSFGTANEGYSNQVGTRWYRAPELLFGACIYATGIDIWALGCILAELLLRVPFFPGNSDLDQLSKVFQTLGTPTETDWPRVSILPHFVPFKPSPAIPFRNIFTTAGDDLLDLIGRMLALNPCKRCTCKEAQMSSYFSNLPYPTPSSELPKSTVAPYSQNNSGSATMRRKLRDSDRRAMAKRLNFD